MNNKSKLSELVESLQLEIDSLESQATEIGYERIISLADFIEQNHDGVQNRFAVANKIGATHTGQMVRSGKFIVVGGAMYRLAKEVV